ncbi:diguanylate cyclase [Clostridium algoriphilum]|uniref:GGDEF domain-containing protein n=1 Tax=Clostridium algoriphilum TaxID=198347 RepID=UPI001CF51C5B|nr:GGDEF domain-containing protein [Clostridium algoriphilum]MCB2292719.1 diguanylate cyclase [Clostridium algoriphilum]
MLNDLFINVLLLIAVTFVAGHILKDVPEKIIITLYGKIIVGVGGGLMGILLMIYTIQVTGTTTILDLRFFAIMMVSYVGGIIPTIVSGIIIGIYRAVRFGINISCIAALFQILLFIICFHIIDKKIKAEWKKWFLKTLISLVILIPIIYYLLRNVENVQIICFEYFLVATFAGALEYFLLEYVHGSNELYRIYKKDSTKDFLTGLYNTRQFDKMLNLAFERVLENKGKLSCFMIDIDHFKKVNDTYGHSIGDIVLKELAYILKKNCRRIDVVGRIGGEEFCVLLFDCPKDQTFSIALRINKAVEKYGFNIGEDKFINITVSIGVAIYPDTTSNLEAIKEEADMALYKAKKSGRNRVCGSEICIHQ